MTSYVTPKKNTAFVFYIGLTSQSNTKTLQANPTLASGDVKVAIDDGAPANLATLPVVDADFTRRVKVSLSADEMNGDNITVIFADAAGAEWCDLAINIQTTARQVDDLTYPTTSGRSLNVSATGEADANLIAWQGETPNALISGRVDVNVGANIVEETRVDGAITQGGETITFTTNLSETQDDKYVGWRFVYTGVGTNSAVTRIVEAYNGTTKAITLNRSLPANSTLGHSFVLWSDEVLTQAGANAAADTALSDIHLDHLLANTYDPASKPGAADALLNELVGNDGGVAQFTANALELGPTGSGATPAEIWANETRTLTQSAAAAYAAVSGDNIIIKRGDDNSISLTGLGALGAWTKLYFTIKERFGDTDAQSLVQIVLSSPGAGTDGLTILNASTSGLTAANGSITVDDAADGDITIRLKQTEAAALSPATHRKYDVQVIRSSGIAVQTLTDGKAVIEGDVTRAVS